MNQSLSETSSALAPCSTESGGWESVSEKKNEQSLGKPLTQSWLPDSQGDQELEAHFQEAFQLSQNFGHTKMPKLLAQLEGEVDATMLPWKRPGRHWLRHMPWPT